METTMPPNKPPNMLSPRRGRLSEAWLNRFYTEVGREVTLARESQRETHNWVITLTVGSVAAVWAMGGGTFNYPTESSLIVVLVMLPLVFRFFVRACLEYQIFNRWVFIRDALNAYFFARDLKPDLSRPAMASLIEQIRLYYFQWRQPRSNGKMIWDNLILAYGWPILLLLLLILLGALLQPRTKLISYTLLAVIPWTVFELWNFYRYFHNKHKQPTHKLDRTLL
jgi:hypothetical protein